MATRVPAVEGARPGDRRPQLTQTLGEWLLIEPRSYLDDRLRGRCHRDPQVTITGDTIEAIELVGRGQDLIAHGLSDELKGWWSSSGTKNGESAGASMSRLDFVVEPEQAHRRAGHLQRRRVLADPRAVDLDPLLSEERCVPPVEDVELLLRASLRARSRARRPRRPRRRAGRRRSATRAPRRSHRRSRGRPRPTPARRGCPSRSPSCPAGSSNVGMPAAGTVHGDRATPMLRTLSRAFSATRPRRRKSAPSAACAGHLVQEEDPGDAAPRLSSLPRGADVTSSAHRTDRTSMPSSAASSAASSKFMRSPP